MRLRLSGPKTCRTKTYPSCSPQLTHHRLYSFPTPVNRSTPRADFEIRDAAPTRLPAGCPYRPLSSHSISTAFVHPGSSPTKVAMHLPDATSMDLALQCLISVAVEEHPPRIATLVCKTKQD